MPSGEAKERSSQRSSNTSDVPPNAFRVLLTGFGPFMHYDENPSWLAVQPLQNVVLETHVTPAKVEASNAAASAAAAKSTSAASSNTTKVSIPSINIPHTPRPIHITTLQIPVLYDAVLEKVPPLYSRPPVLPDDAPSDCVPPPPNGYDFVFHIGVVGRGPLRMERVGHKLGYHMKDASGKYAQIVKVVPKDFSRREQGDGNGPGIISVGSPFAINGTPVEIMDKMGIDVVDVSVFSTTGDTMRPTRGFGTGYENLQDEYPTDIDVTRLVSDLKKAGVEQIYSSMDAGHYLCDFLYYCSLAEVARTIKPYEEKRRTPQVLFLHCPPTGQPLSTEEVTDAITKIIIWVCGEIMIQSLRDEAAAAAGVTSDAPLPALGSNKKIEAPLKKPGPVGGSRA